MLLRNALTRSLLPRRSLHPPRRFIPPRHTYTTTTLPSPPPRTPIHPSTNPTAPLTRDPTRPLPTLRSLSPLRRWVYTLPLFLLILWVSAAGIFNYQKASSPILSATLYALRTNPAVRAELGDEVYFASRWAWVRGSINLVQGRVDVRFGVKGTRGRGVCRFRARREGGRNGLFRTLEWSLTTEDGRVMQLLEDEGRDPLEGTTV